MKINKRECRKNANPGLIFKKNDGLLLVKNIKYIARTAVKNIAGQRVLTVYFYERERAADNSAPEYTLFQCRDDYVILQRLESGMLKWRIASLENLGEMYVYFTGTCAFYRQKDEERVTQFCGYSDIKGFDSLNFLQNTIMQTRLTERIKERERKTVERMKPVTAVPRGLNGWVHREILPHYIYYKYHRSKKPMQGYCTACRHDVTVSGVKHCGAGKCPHCGKAVIFKASGRTKHIFDRNTVQVLQKINGNELVLRIFKVTNTIYDCRNPRFHLFENARIFVRRNESGNVIAEPYYYSYSKGLLTKWQKGERPKISNYQYSFECDTIGHLYCGNTADALKCTPWQYSQLERFYQIDREPLEVLPYLIAYNKYPAIEYLVKLGLTRLAADIIYKYNIPKVINPDGKNIRETLGIESEDLPMFQRMNVTAYQLELYQELRKQGSCADEQLLDWYLKCDINVKENVLLPLRYSTPLKLMRYIHEQFERLKDRKTPTGMKRYEKLNRVLSEYKDYIEMGGQLGYDFSDSFVLFPKNLPEVHDQASTLMDAKKNEIFDKQIQEAYTKLLKQYRFTKNGFTLIPPKSAKEIVQEGHILHHCVHSYVERAAKGECVILFIRKSDNVKEPFFTLELRGNKIIQTRGQGNGSATPEVQKFLELWERKKLLTANTAESA